MENNYLNFSIGIDAVQIERFVNVENVFFKKVFTEKEKNDFLKIDNSNKKFFLAKIWCLKEAIFKANNSYLMKEIEIDLTKNKPICLNKKNLSLSLSYCGKMIIAVAIYINT